MWLPMLLSKCKGFFPWLFFGVLLFLMFNLNAENRRVKAINDQVRSELSRTVGENHKMAETLSTLEREMSQINAIVRDEAARRAQLEKQALKHQEEIKHALKNVPCSTVLVPVAVVNQLRQQAEAIRRNELSSADPAPATASGASPVTVPRAKRAE